MTSYGGIAGRQGERFTENRAGTFTDVVTDPGSHRDGRESEGALVQEGIIA